MTTKIYEPIRLLSRPHGDREWRILNAYVQLNAEAQAHAELKDRQQARKDLIARAHGDADRWERSGSLPDREYLVEGE